MSKVLVSSAQSDPYEALPLIDKNGAPVRKEGSYSVIASFLIFVFPALGGLLFGYDIGATSAVVSQLKSELYSGVSWYGVVASSSMLQGAITSIGMLGAMLGSLTCFRIADDLGRRRSLLVGGVLFYVGSLVEYISGNESYSATKGITILLLGRLIYGYACGFAMHGAPAYIGEMAPSQIRGMLVSLKEVFIVLGMVLGYSLGYMFAGKRGGWRNTYGSASFLAFIMVVGMYYLPYSARWLALKGRINEAKNSLRFVTPNLPESEVEALREIALRSNYNQAPTTLAEDWKKMSTATVLPAMIAGVGLVVFQQITGQPSVLYYAVTIFEDVGLSTFASVAISVFKLVATLFATVTVDRYGRKFLLFIGCGLMFIALFVLGTAFLFDYTSSDECNSYTSLTTCSSECSWNYQCGIECSDTEIDCDCCAASGLTTQKSIILAALFVYIGGYQVGYGPISWLLISEIFPLEVRGKAVSIAVVTNFLFNTIMTFIFPIELEFIGTSATFYIYAIILAFGIYFVIHYVPETKGLTLEEIEDFFLRESKPGGSIGLGNSSYQGNSNSNSNSSGSNNGGGYSNLDKKDHLKLSPII